ncbi:MAG: hypothetical protein IT376_12650 [Polyangiaceae bacterium]|nr:hypothetical protein [Polyangiaceae bacterium]
MMTRTPPSLLAALVLAAWAHQPALALAQAAPGAPRAADAPARRGLFVVVEVGGSGLDAAAIRAAVARDLGIVLAPSAASAAGTMKIRLVARRRVAIELTRESGRALARTIELPETPSEAVEAVALLAGNLGRDEAGELLAELRGAEPSDVSPPPPTEGAAGPSPPGPASPADAADAPAAASGPASGAAGGERAPAPAAAPPAPPPGARAPGAPARPRRAAPEVVEPPPPAALTATPIQVSLLHPVALYRDADERRFHAILGAVHARGGALEGASLVLGLAEIGDVRGLSITVGATSARSASGLLVAAGWNHVEDAMAGVTIAAGGTDQGSLHGLAVAAGGNFARGPVHGLQIAAGGNVARGYVGGLQIAAGANVARGGMHGLQIAAGANVAHGEVNGLQLGLVNVGGHVHGVQLGLVNIADRVDGIPLGLVNVISEGRTRLVLSGDADGFARAGVRYLNGPAYTTLGLGQDLTPSHPRRDDVSADFALGLQAELGPVFAGGEIVYSATTTSNDAFSREPDRHIARYRARAGWQITPWLAPFVAVGVLQQFRSEGNRERLDASAGLEVF